MGIPESQLDTWSHQGSGEAVGDTYGTVKRSLEATDTKYADKSFAVFLQGSYGNDTNIYAESDVDVIIRLELIFFYDTSELKPEDLQTFQSGFSLAPMLTRTTRATLSPRSERLRPGCVEPAKKAVRSKPMETGAMPMSWYRLNSGCTIRLHRVRSSTKETVFLLRMARGLPTVRAPFRELFDEAQATNQWFKPIMRILRNIRSELVDDGVLAAGNAPSYYIEGLLYNVPNDKFGKSYGDIVRGGFQFDIASGQYQVRLSRTRDTAWNGQFRGSWPCADCKISSTKSLSSGTTGCSIALLVYAPSGIPTISRFDHQGLFRLGHCFSSGFCCENRPRVCIRPLRSE